MTKNQIAYQTLVETKSNNARVAAETERANREKEKENLRSNTARESLTRQQNEETNRANLARESLTRDQNIETNRANLAREGLTAQANAEQARANRARESNLEQVLLETRRSNVARERETARSNLAQEAELNRSHLANENLNQQQINELTRHNSVSESISAELNKIRMGELDEQIRSHLAQEGIQTDQLQKDLKALDQRWLEAVMNVRSKEEIAALQRELEKELNSENIKLQQDRMGLEAAGRVLGTLFKLIFK